MNEKKFEFELSRLRDEIDRIDSKMLSLINQRLEIGKKVGIIKKETGSPILDRNRERNLIERLSKMNQGPADNALLKYFFTVIITATREIQKPRTISFLGPEASFTHIAALAHFKHSGKFVEQPNLYEIFREVEKDQSHFGVVPVENSIEGAVNHTLDLFADFDLNICAEHYEPVSHDSRNITRFLVIGKDVPQPSGKDKTSILFATSHEPGALFKALEPIDRAGLNMLKLESRPTRHQNWSYYFFLDIEGHYQDQQVSDTIDDIKAHSLSLKILGSYPVFIKEAMPYD
ncbi:chorismate mutase [Desulfobacula sp.]|uniref:chorismate mutase n=1 Tax=Desulfobacula sp. TaxID=2593537 RepID=UPI00260D6C3B|nr:chorismate mutase [Desulfobacula sp.]